MSGRQSPANDTTNATIRVATSKLSRLSHRRPLFLVWLWLGFCGIIPVGACVCGIIRVVAFDKRPLFVCGGG